MKKAFLFGLILLFLPLTTASTVKVNILELYYWQGEGRDINENGDIAGFEYMNDKKQFGRSWTPQMNLLLSAEPYSNARGINNQGNIAGFVWDDNYNSKIGYWIGLEFNYAEEIADAIYSRTVDINDNKVIVGWTGTEVGPFPTMWIDNAPQLISNEKGAAYALNNKGTIIVQNLDQSGYTYFQGIITDLPFRPYGLNEKDYVVGSKIDTEIEHAYYSNGVSTGRLADFGQGPLFESAAYDINDQDIIVGKAEINDNEKAVIWINNKIYDLNQYTNTEAELIAAYAINNKNQITGAALYQGKRVPFKLDFTHALST